MSCKLEPPIWSRGTGQRIACFDRCQLIIARMSNYFKEVHGKLRLYVSSLEYGRHVGQLRRRRRRRRRRAYAPTSNTASQDNHEKINSWVSFIFPLHDEYGAPLGVSGRRSSAIIDDCNINNLAKNQVSAVFNSRAIRRSVSFKFIEICMETPCWCPSGWAPTWRPETNRNICH